MIVHEASPFPPQYKEYPLHELLSAPLDYHIKVYIITQIAMYLYVGFINWIYIAENDSSRAKEHYFAYSGKRDSIPLTIGA